MLKNEGRGWARSAPSRAHSGLKASWTYLREAVPNVQAPITCSWAQARRTDGLIVLLSWFADERVSLKAKLSAQHVLRAFFTATIDGNFQGAALLDAALSNEETCEQQGDLRTCHHVQELRRSVFAEL